MAKTSTTKRVIEAVQRIPDIAKREKWVFTLDRDEGALFYSKPVIPKNSLLFQVSNEFAIYLDGDNKPSGVFVEAYGVNFIEHHRQLGRISKEVFSDKTKEIEEVNPNTKRPDSKVSLFKDYFEKTVIAEATTAK